MALVGNNTKVLVHTGLRRLSIISEHGRQMAQNSTNIHPKPFCDFFEHFPFVCVEFEGDTLKKLDEMVVVIVD